MKRLVVLILGAATFFAQAMDTGESDACVGLRWLTKDSSYMPAEKATRLSYDWQMGMSFLKRYMDRNFNVYDIYEDVVYFNECESSLAVTYRMTYPQIKVFLDAVSAMRVPSANQPAGQLEQKYIQLIDSWKKFDAANSEYRAAWINRDWQKIRKAIISGK